MKTRARKKNPSQARTEPDELVFVIDVSALTKEGFVGSSKYAGRQLDVKFDDSGEGVFLTADMAARLHVRKGSRVVLVIEEGPDLVMELPVAGIRSSPKVSDPKAYHALGSEGGGVVRLRRA
ncbi:MAG: hypothetical protein JRM99_04085 [Nitrososphaerota archaeon]|nr:hypothetical protein [Nitrososphaerota archaeon]MDG6990582.1 hypothetical protein [Nitrososphaerota archaeon]